MDFGKFAEYGITGLVVAALLFMIWRIIVWAMAWFKEQAAQLDKQREVWMIMFKEQIEASNKEREKWHALHECHQAMLNKIVDSIDKHDEKAEERGKFVREEHRQMIETLGRINGYKHE